MAIIYPTGGRASPSVSRHQRFGVRLLGLCLLLLFCVPAFGGEPAPQPAPKVVILRLWPFRFRRVVAVTEVSPGVLRELRPYYVPGTVVWR